MVHITATLSFPAFRTARSKHSVARVVRGENPEYQRRTLSENALQRFGLKPQLVPERDSDPAEARRHVLVAEPDFV